MHQTNLHPGKMEYFALEPAEFDAAITGWGWPSYRGRQVRDWVYRKGVTDALKMANLSLRQRSELADNVSFVGAAISKHQQSEDGTHKLLLTWADGSNAETVMIPDGQRRTACVSSQVGCPVGCRFCASGVGGVKRNLSAGQIVEQIYALDLILRPINECIGNVVFMGMGEPLANYNNVMKAIRILHAAECFNLGARRITLSTVGVPQKIRDLAEEELPINLAISLHAPEEGLRKSLIPWAEHFSLKEILEAAKYYFQQTGREITLEYILLAEINDHPEHARKLAYIARDLRANVNLIRYNEVEGLPFKRPAAQDVVKFQEVLRANGINAHVRKSRGRDIAAACGQLRRSEQQQMKLL